jgi:D-alanyl-D-alanine dipeptidase
MTLKRAMEAEGFANYDKEWWHYRLNVPDIPLDVPLSCFR